MHNILYKNVPVFVPVFLFTLTVLTFQIKRIISSEKWFNYVVTSFFFENAKKRGWPYAEGLQIFPNDVVAFLLF